ncbi:ATP-grasp domain-containing protein [Salipaludibacillus sp. CUR1]|uniref:ATP-grasp domain-containing protein n=1 Tax=Salipaludibacillus sp. CUR1 TaxID=2820003 RepID=UPI001E36ACC4|nr:ATP-grasp domain-containing protein [Salipaludibacillus sp. CUR1]MCE7792599.1 ATP-grasp domain-containing protein [Salipaludibacillus sp. CUR1]
MTQKEYDWLTHLPPQVMEEAKGHLLCGYALALEGWRRGLTLKWHSSEAAPFKSMKTWYVHKPGKLFSLSSETETHYFFRSRGDKVSNQAVEAGADKQQTRDILKQAGVPAPSGEKFTAADSDQSVISYAEETGYPVVLKPVDGSFGRGVYTNLKNSQELTNALYEVREKSGYKDVIVEEYVPGTEYRLYVVGKKAAAAIERVPANVTGDGKSPIEQLINSKNSERKKNPRLATCPIVVDEQVKHYLTAGGRTLQTVPAEGEVIFLRETSNISLGGDPVDRLDVLPEEVKMVAVNALKAFPDFPHGGVDLIVPADGNRNEAAKVIEVNPTAQIGSLLYPMTGKGRDIPSAIIDYYFPESKAIKEANRHVYPDFKETLLPLEKKIAVAVKVPAPPTPPVSTRMFTVSGPLNWLEVKKRLTEKAVKRNIQGYLKYRSSDNYELAAASGTPEQLNDFINEAKELTGDGSLTEDTVSVSPTFFKQGFRIVEPNHQRRVDLHKINKKLKRLRLKRKVLLTGLNVYSRVRSSR